MWEEKGVLGNVGRERVCQVWGYDSKVRAEYLCSAGPLEKSKKKIKYFHFSIDILLYKVVYYKHTKEQEKTK